MAPITNADLRAMNNMEVHKSRKDWIRYHYRLLADQICWRAHRGLTTMSFPLILLKRADASYTKKGEMKQRDIDSLRHNIQKKFPEVKIHCEVYDDPQSPTANVDFEVSWI